MKEGTMLLMKMCLKISRSLVALAAALTRCRKFTTVLWILKIFESAKLKELEPFHIHGLGGIVGLS